LQELPAAGKRQVPWTHFDFEHSSPLPAGQFASEMHPTQAPAASQYPVPFEQRAPRDDTWLGTFP
jgi:hypothetical protein